MIIIPIIILGSSLGIVIFFFLKSILNPKKVSNLADLVKQGKISTATRIAKQILAKDHRNGDAHYLLGLTYIADNRPELALMEMKSVNQIGNFSSICPENEFRKKIAELYLRFEQPEEALKEYLLLAKLEPHQAEHFYSAGIIFEMRNRTDKAINFYRKAIELNPRHSESHYQLGYLLYRNKKPVEAKHELESALKTDPQNFKAHFYLGKLLKESHDNIAALLAFERSQKEPEFKIKALVERGGCYLSMNSYEKAISELERAVKLSKDEINPESLYGRYFLALCYEKTRDFDKAISLWEFIYSKKPNFRDVAEKLSQYQDLRTDDKMKDYLIASLEEYQGICRNLVLNLGLSVRDVSNIPNGCEIIAVETDSKWRNARKLPQLLRFFRVPELIAESTVRIMHEDMKKLNIARGLIFSSSNFSRKAIEFAESRPIDLFNKDKLQELLDAIEV